MFAGTLVRMYGRVVDAESKPPAGRRTAQAARSSRP
jgi:hypothetical protein